MIAASRCDVPAVCGKRHAIHNSPGMRDHGPAANMAVDLPQTDSSVHASGKQQRAVAGKSQTSNVGFVTMKFSGSTERDRIPSVEASIGAASGNHVASRRNSKAFERRAIGPEFLPLANLPII